MNIFVGIDVGKGGAIATINSDLAVECWTTPTLSDGDIDARTLYSLLIKIGLKGNVRMIIVEKVHAIFGAGAGSTFEFGRSAGIAEASVCASGFPYMMVPPKTWQKEMWSGVDKVIKSGKKSVDTKATSLVAVNRLFPSVTLTDPSKPKSNKVHDGIVDAILLAEYGRRLWTGAKQ